MKKRTIIGLAVLAAAVATMFAAPTVASATDVPDCQRGEVAADWFGDGSFTISATRGDCGLWLTAYVGVDRQLKPGDYSHAQVAKEWAWAHITNTPTVYSVKLPDCDNVQVDAYLGSLQLELAHGDLGEAFVAGGVIERPGKECAVVPPVTPPRPEPTPPVVTEPPVVIPPVVEPVPPVTSPLPVPPVTNPEVPSSNPGPATDPTPGPTPVLNPANTESSSAPITIPESPKPVSSAAPTQRTAPIEALAHTGSDGWKIGGLIGLLLILAGGIVVVIRKMTDRKVS